MNIEVPGEAPAIEVERLSKSFGTVEVLKSVDFAVRSGEKLCLVGPSGSGKTTLLRCLNLLEIPTSGVLRARGAVVGQWPSTQPLRGRALAQFRSKTGMVFQHFDLFAHMTALDNTMLGPRRSLNLSAAEARERGMDALAEVGLSAFARSYPHQLSGGQQQRVAIARALAMKPEVLLFDEPTSALDPELVGEVLAVMEALADKGTTMVVVTHELRFAQAVADRLIVMDAGRIIESGKPADLIRNPAQERTKQFFQSIRNEGAA
jgi:ABC-type polar amino acid transport system ATPase subunit